jgi:hypothetical protein
MIHEAAQPPGDLSSGLQLYDEHANWVYDIKNSPIGDHLVLARTLPTSVNCQNQN